MRVAVSRTSWELGWGHAGGRTFRPDVESALAAFGAGYVYMDCPGFLDNRGPEINIANAVNTRAMISAAKSVRLLVLINFHTLEADRGRGLQDMVRILLEHGALVSALNKWQKRCVRACDVNRTKEREVERWRRWKEGASKMLSTFITRQSPVY